MCILYTLVPIRQAISKCFKTGDKLIVGQSVVWENGGMKIASGQLQSIDFTRFDNLKFESTFDNGTLFPLDMRDAVVKHVCPYCQRRLYEMRDRPLVYCKNRLHKRFVMDKGKLIPN